MVIFQAPGLARPGPLITPFPPRASRPLCCHPRPVSPPHPRPLPPSNPPKPAVREHLQVLHHILARASFPPPAALGLLVAIPLAEWYRAGVIGGVVHYRI